MPFIFFSSVFIERKGNNGTRGREWYRISDLNLLWAPHLNAYCMCLNRKGKLPTHLNTVNDACSRVQSLEPHQCELYFPSKCRLTRASFNQPAWNHSVDINQLSSCAEYFYKKVLLLISTAKLYLSLQIPLIFFSRFHTDSRSVSGSCRAPNSWLT